MGEGTGRRIITSRAEYFDAVRRAFAEAVSANCLEMWISDVDFAEWPLGERAVVEHLTLWAQARRKIVMFAATYDEIPRRHARFVEWRRIWGHQVECRSPEGWDPKEMPSLLLAPGVVTLRLIDRENFRAVESFEDADATAAADMIDAISQRSVDAFPITLLGL